MGRLTVRELIEALEDEDPEAIVYVDVPKRYLKEMFYEAFFTVEEVSANSDPKRVNLFSFESSADEQPFEIWAEERREEYTLMSEYEG